MHFSFSPGRRFVRRVLAAAATLSLMLAPVVTRSQQHGTPPAQQPSPQGMGVSTGPNAVTGTRRTAGIVDPKAPAIFEDVTARTALAQFRNHTGSAQKDYIVECVSAGVAVLDYDNDGLPDIYVSNFGVSRLYHNIGYAWSHLGHLDKALDAYNEALARAIDPAEQLEGKHSRSICLIGMGRIREGFEEFEVRNDTRFRAYVHHLIQAPVWKGEDLNGKRMLVVAEQGLGDEFMFANILPDLQDAVGETGKLEIAVDPRLITLFQRSFPKAEVGRYDDRTLIDKDGNKSLRFVPFSIDKGEPNYWAPMGTPLHIFRKSLEDFAHKAFLVPDPERVADYAAQLAMLGDGPKIGICWRSMMLGAKRAKYYSALDAWGPILKVPGVTFVNLQYGDCADELARAAGMHGVTIHRIEGLDLKDDIDGAAALSAALDLVISAPTAAAATAASVGAEVWFTTAGRTWPQLGTDEYPWYRKTRVFSPEKFGDWNDVIPRIGEALAEFAR